MGRGIRRGAKGYGELFQPDVYLSEGEIEKITASRPAMEALGLLKPQPTLGELWEKDLVPQIQARYWGEGADPDMVKRLEKLRILQKFEDIAHGGGRGGRSVEETAYEIW
jgi:hypothetical protein